MFFSGRELDSPRLDACPREAVASWIAYLRSEYPAFLFRSATAFLLAGSEQVNVKVKGKGKAKVTVPTDDGVGVDSVLECLGQWAQEKKNEVPLTVTVVGITNVSLTLSLCNLAHRFIFRQAKALS